MIDHPSSEELAALVRGGLRGERMRGVVRHLLLPCPPCAGVVAAAIEKLHDPEPVPEDEYDVALDRALEKVLRREQQRRQRQAEAERLEALLAERGIGAVQNMAWETDSFALFDALLARSWSFRHDKPAEMVRFADAAVKYANNLEACVHGLLQVTDLRCRAWAELGNAFRVSDNYTQAVAALALARELFEQGTKDEFLEIRLTELEASLAADRRIFAVALLKLTQVYRFYRRKRNHHMAGRALILKGLYTNYAGRPNEAIDLLREGRSLLDPEIDPDLVYSAAHNEYLCLTDSGRILEAKRLRVERSRELSFGKGRVSRVRLRAIDGRVDVAEGKYERAEGIFREVKQDFIEIGRIYHAALAGLDLATVLLHRRRSAEGKEEALDAIQMFLSLQIAPEAFASVIVLRQCFEMRIATPALVQDVTDYLRRAEYDPDTQYIPSASLRIP